MMKVKLRSPSERSLRSMTTRIRPVTAEELLRMPDDGFRYELVRGELRKMPPAGNEHGYRASELSSELRNHFKANGLGRVYAVETGFKIHSDPTPDAAFVSREPLEEAGPVKGYWPGVPDLAAEVISSNDRHTEVVEKALEGLDSGCRMVLVVDPKRHTVTVYRSRENIRILAEREALDGADVIPGFSLPITKIFA
jgi:Uma2 family endonuclease